MNERIRELEIQCWEPRQYGPAWFNSTKFAELIVRECAEINKQELSFNAFERLMNKYKEHFGVEE